ncbi:MAG: hypothetical protein ACHQIF_11040 [Steroidobacterales bacterium]
MPKVAEAEVSSVARYDFRAEPPPNVPVGAGAGSGGGNMDDVLRRLGLLEDDVSVIKTDVAGIAAQIPGLATKADMMAVKAEVAGIAAQLPGMATKADLMATNAVVAGIAAQIPYLSTRAQIGDLKASIIQWMVGTAIAIAALVLTIDKFVH